MSELTNLRQARRLVAPGRDPGRAARGRDADCRAASDRSAAVQGGRGLAEVEEALDILAAQPATAHHVCARLVLYFVVDAPPPALVDWLAAVFTRTRRQIAPVMAAMIASPEFRCSLGNKFKDPTHYVLSAVRLAYDNRTIVNTQPIEGWLNRLAEGLYNHPTPDGYPLDAIAWNGPGQLAVRFEIARQIGCGAARLFRAEGAPLPAALAPGAPPAPQPPVPDLRDRAAALFPPQRGGGGIAGAGRIARRNQRFLPVVISVHAPLEGIYGSPLAAQARRQRDAAGVRRQAVRRPRRERYPAARRLPPRRVRRGERRCPLEGDFYTRSRPTISIARPGPANPLAALPLDAN